MIWFIIFMILLITGGVAYLVYYLKEIGRINDRIKWAEKRHYTLLRILVARNNTKTPFAAEQMFSAIHGIYRNSEELQEHMSFEIAANRQTINFYLLVPTQLKDFIEGQIYSQYPTVEIEAIHDYSNVSLENKALVGAEVALTKNDFFPIKTFANFDVDPLAGLTGVLSKIDEGELLAIQFVLSPIDDDWQKEGLTYVKNVREGKDVKPPPPLHVAIAKQGTGFVKEVVTQFFKGPTEPPKDPGKKDLKLSGPEDVALKGIETKVTKLGFAVSIRVMAITNDEALSEVRVQSVLGALKQFNTTNLNGFQVGTIYKEPEFLRTFRSRSLGAKPFRLNVEELASLFHFPDTSVETPNIVWVGSKKGESPHNLPIEGEVPAEQLTTFGLTSFRNRNIRFGIKTPDRRLHMYAIGKTGTGKSTLIQNMVFDDIREGKGVAVVDPHGELVQDILNFIPEERIKDVVYFNPADVDFPLAFNLLESVDKDMRNIVASGLMSIFTKLWANVWSARMEYILRNAILAALEVPNSTLLSIMRLLNDPVYRKYVLTYVTDPVVRDFFINEYEKYDAKFRQEAIAPIQNKVGQFLSSSTIRNIVGQPQSTFNLGEIMDSGKILLVNLSIGLIGEDNSALLGAMMITKIQLAAMGRARIAQAERRDFYLYVDEFQNFATDSFATILSEARKYHLNLMLVNQYIAQIPEVVADAIFGNVGTLISFRVGATDAETLVKEFAPTFEANDLVNLPNRQIYVKMAIDGVTSQAFSAHTLPPKGIVNENAPLIAEASRKRYARDRKEVEEKINALAQADYRPSIEKEYDELRVYPFIINGTLYKEFSTKGGQKWYFGQPPEDEGDNDTIKPTEPAPVEKSLEPKPQQKAEPALLPAVPTSETKEVIAKPEPEQAIIKEPEPLAIVESDPKQSKPNPAPKPVAHTSEKPDRGGESDEKREEVKEEAHAKEGDDIAPKTHLNRGHQHDDWLPLEELS